MSQRSVVAKSPQVTTNAWDGSNVWGAGVTSVRRSALGIAGILMADPGPQIPRPALFRSWPGRPNGDG
jgi:hypothetical protein